MGGLFFSSNSLKLFYLFVGIYIFSGELIFYYKPREVLTMSRSELLTEIERLRSRMNDLAASGAEFTELLEVSQQLDLLIVEYHKTAM
jgi:hypothetical protein